MDEQYDMVRPGRFQCTESAHVVSERHSGGLGKGVAGIDVLESQGFGSYGADERARTRDGDVGHLLAGQTVLLGHFFGFFLL